MWSTLRNTLSRGRSFVPAIRLRWRSWIRTRRSSFVLIFIVVSRSGSSRTLPIGISPEPAAIDGLLRSRLAGLLLQHFAGVADTLLLVRIRLAQAADVRRHLPDQLPIDAGYRDVRLLVDGHVDPLRDVEDHRVRVA